MTGFWKRAGSSLAGAGVFVFIVALFTGSAESAPSVRTATPAAGAAVAAASTGAGEADVRDRGEAELAPGCQRVRRKLFVESEGWIVRRVTICH
jgi:hypothetical protein